MHPIAINEDEKFDEEGFRQYIMKVCDEHKRQKRAIAFAFIVYDFADQSITQILDYEKYLIALDAISGKFLTVFYINSQDSYFKRRQRENYNQELKQRQDVANKFSYLAPLNFNPTPLDNTIDYIKQEFQISNTFKPPFVLFFQTDGEEISDFFIVSLKQEKLEEAFFELKAHIKNAVDALSKVQIDKSTDQKIVFEQLKLSVEGGKFYNFIKTKILPKISLASIFTLIKLIAHSVK